MEPGDPAIPRSVVAGPRTLPRYAVYTPSVVLLAGPDVL